ncbi:fungal-specific transcription factor domain-containing protein [Hypomontagnella monticulosa]|nr:fungal-specific transcription factor domain-containing protein [Hypomontagnella monticulosa]
MTSPASQSRPGPVTIAPALNKTSTTTTTTTPSAGHGSPSPHPNVMPYTCQTCVRRKVKCDRTTPICSSCARSKLECLYRAPPPPRPRRRKRNDEQVQHVRGHVAPGERVMSGNSAQDAASSASSSHKKEEATIGTLLAGDGKSRYIDSRIWLDAGDEVDVREMSAHEEDDQSVPAGDTPLAQDPISCALLGVSQNLLTYHPSHKDAMKLWAAHVQNVEPLCKVLHIPTTARMVETVSRQPASASKPYECLLFSIYHIAIFSMTDDDCVREFGQPRTALLDKYQFAVRQALVNASWLKTTEMVVIQAMVLFLIPMRSQIDHHTFWIMTGVAVRIAQRMGLHRDGESLGLSPFDVQMRRRLWWQLLPLDGYAGQFSGTGIAITPNSWDTKQPSNINDDQIYPSMAHRPEEQKGASEMIFCLTRAELSNFYTRTGVKTKDIGPTIELRDSAELERLIDQVEDIIESKYLRYCDIVTPLHFLTLAVVRSATNTVRLRNRIPTLIKRTIGDEERRALCVLAQKILDSDSAIYRNPNINKFQWQIKAFFLWDALICILTSLAKAGFFACAELNMTWSKMAEVYTNHPEILEGKGAFHVAVGKVTLEAWKANPPSNSTEEPAFITMLQSQHRRINAAKHPEVPTGQTTPSSDGPVEAMSSLDALFGSLDGTDLNFEGDLFSTADWTFWDQFSQPHGPTFG